MFADEGIPVLDSDSVVHDLYGGPAAAEIGKAFPGTVRNGVVDRTLLSKSVLGDQQALKRLEALVHPMVAQEREKFLTRHRNLGDRLVVLDIPLLFETGGADLVDKVVVVTADPEVQRERVMSRPGMTSTKFEAILARQIPDAEKRARADFIIDTGLGMEAAREGGDEDHPGIIRG